MISVHVAAAIARARAWVAWYRSSLVAKADGDWDEDSHPRGEGGKFGSGGGAKAEKPGPKSEEVRLAEKEIKRTASKLETAEGKVTRARQTADDARRAADLAESAYGEAEKAGAHETILEDLSSKLEEAEEHANEREEKIHEIEMNALDKKEDHEDSKAKLSSELEHEKMLGLPEDEYAVAVASREQKAKLEAEMAHLDHLAAEDRKVDAGDEANRLWHLSLAANEEGEPKTQYDSAMSVYMKTLTDEVSAERASDRAQEAHDFWNGILDMVGGDDDDE